MRSSRAGIFPVVKVFSSFVIKFIMITRPVWTGFKIAVRHKLLTHYKKAKVLYDKSKDGLKVDIVKTFINK